ERLADVLARAPRGAIGRDAASRAVLAALDDDLDTARAIRLLERSARTDPDAKTRASLAAIARVLGVVRG
ncbi:MAG: hypothetical protein ACRDF0_09365, partial [Candidatus Limnocylindria bacterium]